MKILYSIQSTGLGHITPYLALGRALLSRGHELVTLTAGPHPSSFFKPLSKKYCHFDGPTLILDHERLSYTGTTIYNLVRSPRFLANLFKVKSFIERERPDLILLDYEPYTSNYIRFWKPEIPSFSLDHQSTFLSPAFPLGRVDFALSTITHIFTFAQMRLCANFVDYGGSGNFITVPPILREEALSIPVTDQGYTLIYHSSAMPEDKKKIKTICPKNGEFIFYGYESEVFENLIFKPKGPDFVRDLAGCHAFVTNCGLVSVTEALMMGKKIICQPLKRHSEQEWNGRMLNSFPNVRVVDQLNYADLRVNQLELLDKVKQDWLRRGLEVVLKYILKEL